MHTYSNPILLQKCHIANQEPFLSAKIYYDKKKVNSGRQAQPSEAPEELINDYLHWEFPK
jgi:hypothetical protein